MQQTRPIALVTATRTCQFIGMKDFANIVNSCSKQNDVGVDYQSWPSRLKSF
jgi:hypothetical protein